nr:uncharacterized protein LOC109150426 [Ipomoea batatas]
MGKIESQRSVFDRLGSNPQAPKRKSIHDRLRVVQDVKNNASHPVEAAPSKRPRSMIPSRMRRQTDIHISCGEVLKVQPRTIVHTHVQKGENEESVGSSDDVAPPQGEGASSFHITLCDEIPIEGEDAEEAPHELEEGVRAAIDELKEVDLGTPKNPRPIFISTLLSDEDEEIYVELLKEYIDVFAWTYKEMPGLDPKVAVHRLAVKKTCRPVKQAQRRFRPELIPSIEGEVNKLIEAGFIREVKYPTWISSIVPVRKKNGQIRVCVDFRDLNVACSKDNFPLPITELMIDAVTRHEIMSFMDGSSGYNQIRMAPEDEELTAFRTPKGIYCYKVMPFGLKNAGATYQMAMQRIFDDMLHKMVECYVDDLVVKSKLRTDHLRHLRKVFDRLRNDGGGIIKASSGGYGLLHLPFSPSRRAPAMVLGGDGFPPLFFQQLVVERSSEAVAEHGSNITKQSSPAVVIGDFERRRWTLRWQVANTAAKMAVAQLGPFSVLLLLRRSSSWRRWRMIVALVGGDGSAPLSGELPSHLSLLQDVDNMQGSCWMSLSASNK